MTKDATQKPVRVILLESGAHLAQQRGTAAGLDLVEVCTAADVVPQLFYTYFPDLRHYLLALMQHYLDLARAEAIETIGRTPTGVPRVAAAFECYWDANLRWRPMRELALHFRSDAEGAEILRLRLQGVTLIAQHELKSIGWPFPAATARLAGVMCVECAIAEYEAQRALPEMREAVLTYFREPRPRFSSRQPLP